MIFLCKDIYLIFDLTLGNINTYVFIFKYFKTLLGEYICKGIASQNICCIFMALLLGIIC